MNSSYYRGMLITYNVYGREALLASARAATCQRHAIPKDLPPKITTYDYFDLWIYQGIYVHGRESARGQCDCRHHRCQSAKSVEKRHPPARLRCGQKDPFGPGPLSIRPIRAKDWKISIA
jgi:hypothetical protein